MESKRCSCYVPPFSSLVETPTFTHLEMCYVWKVELDCEKKEMLSNAVVLLLLLSHNLELTYWYLSWNNLGIKEI